MVVMTFFFMCLFILSTKRAFLRWTLRSKKLGFVTINQSCFFSNKGREEEWKVLLSLYDNCWNPKNGTLITNKGSTWESQPSRPMADNPPLVITLRDFGYHDIILTTCKIIQSYLRMHYEEFMFDVSINHCIPR
jgi:hypothetical protein